MKAIIQCHNRRKSLQLVHWRQSSQGVTDNHLRRVYPRSQDRFSALRFPVN
jgi:hypothetical protein